MNCMSLPRNCTIAIYTSRPSLYAELYRNPEFDWKVTTSTELARSRGTEEFVATLIRPVDDADVVIIDFDGINNMSPMAVFLTAAHRLILGEVKAVAVIGVEDISIEDFTPEQTERAAVAAARHEERLSFVSGPEQLATWIESAKKFI
jgi:hypothetical protein